MVIRGLKRSIGKYRGGESVTTVEGIYLLEALILQ
jgi:hypothetical protein